MDPIRPGKNQPTAAPQPYKPQGLPKTIRASAREERLMARLAQPQVPQGRVTTMRQLFETANAQVAARRNQEAEGEIAPNNKPLSHDDQKVIRNSIKEGKKVYVAGFSSQGGGHTARMLTPLGKAAKEGDTVVLNLPPHWERDKGNESTKLAKFKGEYHNKGIKVVTTQADKAVWGFYKEGGPSDNFRILEEFANKPKRDASQTPIFGEENTGQGFKHHDIMEQVLEAVGEANKDQITVFEDMDPYLGKAAEKAGIPKDSIVGLSNHVTLLDADDYFGNRSDAFLVKASGGGHNGKMSTVAFSRTINSTMALGNSLTELDLRSDQTAVSARKEMVDLLMRRGNNFDLTSNDKIDRGGSLLYHPDATASTIDRGFFIYLNDYTEPLADHIIEKMKSDDGSPETEAFKKTMFVFCGSKTCRPPVEGSDEKAINAMHVAQAANFDGISSAGFGTASEMHYLISNDAYQGSLVLMPIEQQHEQEANALSLLPDATEARHMSRITTALNMEQLSATVDGMVLNGSATNESMGQETMESLFAATQNKVGGDAADRTANLLRGEGTEMTDSASRLLDENNSRANDPDRQQIRQLNKVMIPVLEAIVEGKPTATILLTTKDEERTINIKEMVDGFGDADQFRELTGFEVTGDKAMELQEKFAADLQQLMEMPAGPVREDMADTYRRGEYANETYTLGY